MTKKHVKSTDKDNLDEIDDILSSYTNVKDDIDDDSDNSADSEV